MTSNTSMVHARIEDEIKSKASETLADVGLTVSDAIRILLTRIAKEGIVPVELISNTEAYDEWFKAKVHEALNDSRPTASHQDVMSDIQSIIDRKKHA